MAEEKIYNAVLDYMCSNYDYSLYATDFNAHKVTLLMRSIALLSSPAGGSRMVAIKSALEDFFNAIFQKIFVYEDEERLKIVKYFDNGATNEQEDRQIHALRLELVKYKDEVFEVLDKNQLFMFDESSRRRFEITLVGLKEIPIKEMLREQFQIVFDLDKRDIVVFLNKKIFLKKFNIQEGNRAFEEKKVIFKDKRLSKNLLEEIKRELYKSFEEDFIFYELSPKRFYEIYPKKLFAIIKRVLKESFEDIKDEEITEFSNFVFKESLLELLEECSKYLFERVLEQDLKAIKFLKSYSESTSLHKDILKLQKIPLINSKGKIYKYKNILDLLKEKELIISKMAHKGLEIKSLQTKVEKAYNIVKRSEDEMQNIQKRRRELLKAIEKVEDEIKALQENPNSKNIDINRLEFSKRDLLEAFKQVEFRLRTQENILINTNIDLKKWEEKKADRLLLLEDLKKKSFEIFYEYDKMCEIFARNLSKEPIEF